MESSSSKREESVTPILQISDLSVARSGEIVIQEVNLDIRKGEFVGLVGPNGSGKTTLLLTILGLLEPVPNSGGKVRLYGNEGFSKSDHGRIGWVPQAGSKLSSHVRITVMEIVRLGTLSQRNMFILGDSIGNSRVQRALEMVGLADKADTDISRLSGGELQRTVIARALASKADFLLLDEPLVGVDLPSRNSLLKLLDNLCHKENMTVLMVSHDLTAISQAAHRIIYLEGSVMFDGPSEDLPDFSSLAGLRGIKHVHDDHSHGH
tara:strand:+ start:30 stop:824 length:795 start_codon:yes stop_codon:yes gene_type:complete